jgi:peptide-methionine (S)-S-oxide reductase
LQIHDPTTPNRQGNDVGPQYRSIILYTSQQQKETAEQAMAEVTKEGLYPNPLVTELVPLEKLWPGEDYHQNYYNDNPNQVNTVAGIPLEIPLEGGGVSSPPL